MRDVKQKGITLIALVITIVVILILAGVTIATLTGDNSIMNRSTEAKIMTNLSKVDEAIKLYKSAKKIDKVVDEGSNVEVTNDDLLNEENPVLKEYVIEETLRPIAVVENYDKLGISEKFGEGYNKINDYDISGEIVPYIATLSELNNVCAIDLIDGTLYYLENGKVWSIGGKTDIANNYERVEAQEGEWEYTNGTLTKYIGDLTTVRGEQQVGEIIVPNYFNGTRVSGIGNSVFANNALLTKLTISNGIRTIAISSFKYCTNLTGNLIIPDSVTDIGGYAFIGCSSLDGMIKIGNNVQIIGGNAFQNCSNLKGDLTIPDSVTSIGGEAFRGCSSLDGNIRIGNKVEIIGGYAFEGCSNLKGDLIIPDTVISIGGYSFIGCSSLDGIIKIGNNVQTIGGNAFQNCSNLKGNLIIPDSVTSIGGEAFRGCNSLDGNIRIGNKVETIGGAAFHGCSNLKGDLIIPDSVTDIGGYAFIGCSSLDGIIKIGNNVQTIGGNAFQNCSNLKGDLTIPDSVTSIGGEVFRGCNSLDGNIRIGNKVETIGGAAFHGCSNLKGDLVIPDSVISIGGYAFIGCSSLNGMIKIGNKVETIEQYAFQNCSSSVEVRLPMGIKSIGTNAFLNLADGSIIYLQDASLESLVEGKYTTGKTTVVVDASKFE